MDYKPLILWMVQGLNSTVSLKKIYKFVKMFYSKEAATDEKQQAAETR